MSCLLVLFFADTLLSVERRESIASDLTAADLPVSFPLPNRTCGFDVLHVSFPSPRFRGLVAAPRNVTDTELELERDGLVEPALRTGSLEFRVRVADRTRDLASFGGALLDRELRVRRDGGFENILSGRDSFLEVTGDNLPTGIIIRELAILCSADAARGRK